MSRAEDILNAQAAQCVNLANAVKEVLHGHDLQVALVVLLRLAVMGAVVGDVSRNALESQFKHIVDDVYSNPPPADSSQETMQ